MDGQLPLGFIGSCLSSVLLSSVSVRIKSICIMSNKLIWLNYLGFLTVLCVSNIIGVSSPQLIKFSFYRFSSLPVQLYLVDSFTYAASATSAAGVSFSLLLIFCSLNLRSIVQLFRSLFGFAFPLFAEQMFAKLGLGGGNSVCLFLK